MTVVEMYTNVAIDRMWVYEYFLSVDPPIAQQIPDKTANKSPMFNGYFMEFAWDNSKNNPKNPMPIETNLALVKLSFNHITPIAVAQIGDR